MSSDARRAQGREVRRLIRQRAVYAGLSGLVPVPYLDDYLLVRGRSQLLAAVARAASVGVEDEACRILAEPAEGSVVEATGLGAAALALARRRLRRLGTALFLLRRADEALFTYQIGILFDHYCRALHVGPPLGADRAVLLRKAMSLAITATRREAIGRSVEMALARSSALGRRMLRSVDGAQRRLLGRDPAPPAPDDLQGPVPAPDGPPADLEERYARLLGEALERAWGTQLVDSDAQPGKRSP